MKFLILVISLFVTSMAHTASKGKTMKFVSRSVYITDQEKLSAFRPQHVAYLQKLASEGKILMSGPSDNGGGMTIFEVESKEEFEKLVAQDPFVKEGLIAKKDLFFWEVKITKR